MPLLSELPSDSTKRDAVLDTAGTTAGPEQRKGMTPKQRKAETAAATAAAILGSAFSTTQSVTLGSATSFDETQLVAPQPLPPLPRSPSTNSDRSTPTGPPSNPATAPDANLVPWIKLK
jgi:hypothetical protein